jgi:hypothetical protein
MIRGNRSLPLASGAFSEASIFTLPSDTGCQAAPQNSFIAFESKLLAMASAPGRYSARPSLRFLSVGYQRTP